MIHFTILVFCVYCLMHINEGLNSNDFQYTNPKDPAREDKVEFYGSNEIYSDESGKKLDYVNFKLTFIL